MAQSFTHDWNKKGDTLADSYREFSDNENIKWIAQLLTEDKKFSFKISSQNKKEFIPRWIRVTVFWRIQTYDNRTNTIENKKISVQDGFNFRSGKYLVFDKFMAQEHFSTITIEIEKLKEVIHALPTLPNTISADFGSLLKSEEFSDVKICTHQSKFRAHRIILSFRSAVFKEILNRKSSDGTINSVIEVYKFDADIIQMLLDYMYTDQVDLEGKDQGKLARLYQAANTFQLKGLKLLCENMLLRNLSVKNVVQTMILANVHNSPELKSEVFDYFIANSEEISKTESWAKMLKESSELANEAMEAYDKSFSED